jgi:acetyl esterase/lipase
VQVAQWFNARGVAAFVLKYRLPSDEIMKDKSVGPLQDVQEAIRTVRRRAAEWKVDPAKIGIMGFSAGGHLAGTASTMYAERVYEPADATSARPDFSILVYGVLSFDPAITHGGSRQNLLGKKSTKEEIERFSNELHVNAKTPPAFLVHSQNDKTVPVENSIRYYQAMTKNGVPGELHLYEKGAHGYGFGNQNTPTAKHWPEALAAWMASRGLL